jgi:hypothetical protein
LKKGYRVSLKLLTVSARAFMKPYTLKTQTNYVILLSYHQNKGIYAYDADRLSLGLSFFCVDKTEPFPPVNTKFIKK